MKLWCILEGLEDPFWVQVNDRENMHDLKKAIKAGLESTFCNVDAMFIKLWRIHKSVHKAQQLTAASFEGEEPPDGAVSVGEYWADLTADVHVFIAKPPGKSIWWLRRQLASIKLTFY